MDNHDKYHPTSAHLMSSFNMSSANHDRPFHVLMTTSQDTHPEMKDRRIANDYLARRAAACNTPQTNLWSGVSPIERALAECCELDGDESLDVVVEGALMLKSVIRFVELMAKHCYKATTRVLVITILERTLEQDHLNRQEEESSDESKKHRPNCFSRFLAAGGLKILNQWLLEAMTPTLITSKQKQQPATKKLKSSTHPSKSQELVPSAHGPLLIPLLDILERMPMDKQLVTSTKINKTIRQLDKQLADLPKKSTDPHAGGYITEDVLNAIESLKDSWRNERTPSEGPAKDPFRKVQQTLTERLQALNEYDAGRIDKPDWLIRFENVEKLAKDKKELSKMTPEERQRRLALLDIRRKRADADRKLEELQAKKVKMSSCQAQKSKKVVTWKDGKEDGKGPQMVDIFYYPPEIDSKQQPLQEPEGFSDDDDDMWS